MSSGTRRITRMAQRAAWKRTLGHMRNALKRSTHLFPYVCVAATEELFDLVAQVSRHLLRGDVGKGAKRKAHCVHVGVVHIATSPRQH